jgi:putative hydrolase of the HAD superfamily
MTERTTKNDKYTSIFFDLDHTLWDFESNSNETLAELYVSYNLASKGVTSLHDFQKEFKKVNTLLWDLYDAGQLDSATIRKERFKQILQTFEAHEEKLCFDLSADYLQTCPQKGKLMPYAIEVLEYLKQHYKLTIITNGFEEIQHLKMTAGNLHGYFDNVITSQKAGCRKPSRGIFDFALNHHAITCHQAIMIGDNLNTDMGGARDASIDHVFYNPEKIPHNSVVTHEISCLSELRRIL